MKMAMGAMAAMLYKLYDGLNFAHELMDTDFEHGLAPGNVCSCR